MLATNMELTLVYFAARVFEYSSTERGILVTGQVLPAEADVLIGKESIRHVQLQ